MKTLRSFLVLASLLLLFSACQKDDVVEPLNPMELYNFEEIMVDISNPWFATMDDSSAKGIIETKSKNSSASLKSLLDYSAKQSISFGPKKITQVPFYSNAEPDYFCRFADEHSNVVLSADSLLISKKYFIETKEKGETFSYVANLLIDFSYAKSIGIGNISYLEHPGFSGYIVFSDVYGNLLQISHYKWGEIKHSEIIRDESYDSSDKGIALISPVIMAKTKGGDNEITPAIIVAEKPTRLKDSDSQEDNYKPENISYKPGGGGGGSSNGNKDGEDRESEQKRLDENKTIQEWLSRIQITSETDSKERIQKLKDTMQKLSEINSPVFHNLLLALCENYDTGDKRPNIKINISNVILNPSTQPRHGKETGNFTGVNISFPCDKIGEDSYLFIAEEFFHAYQYFLIKTSNDSRWKDGDIEFEGKIFDYYFIQYSNNKSIYFEDYLPFKDFNDNRNASNYQKAVEALRNLGYSEEDFPMNESIPYNNRTKHYNY